MSIQKHILLTGGTGLKAYFQEVDLALFCLAVYAGTVSNRDYRKITVEYTEVFTETLKEQSPESIFCLFSAAGADSKEKSRMQFARDKGASENVVFNAGFPRVHAFRPGYIYPVVKREEPSFTYRVVRRLYPLLKVIYPDGVVTSEQLAKAMVTIGLEGGRQAVYENREIRKIEVQ